MAQIPTTTTTEQSEPSSYIYTALLIPVFISSVSSIVSTFLRISGNPIVCDSRLDALHLAVIEGRLKHDHVICASPPDVAGMPLSSLTPGEYL